LLMNEVFGEENFIDCIIWKKRYGGGAKEKFLVSLHEYVLVYAKNLAELPEIFIPLSQKSIDRYYKLKDKNFGLRGAYRTHPLEATKSMGERKNLVYPIPAPDGTEVMPKRQWLWGKERAQKALHDGELEFIKGKDRKWTVHTKQYLSNENGEIRKDKAFSIVDDVYTQHGTNEIIDLFDNAQIFSFPKPTAFINFLINIGINDKTGIILDFFPGSCTTAHAVFDINRQDNGTRKFICVQLPEKCDEKSEAFKAGYKTIADIGKERIRRVIKKIKDSDNGKLPFARTKQDLGFKVFKLQASNFKIWRGDNIKNGRQLEKHMQLHLDSVKKDAIEENMLFELLLKSGRNL
ncbi:MAG: site-specific DNA-methyltransferase, partial [Gammaproteobacteria bacterium]|nr:site-specific DNA-methyltransferase [Gammaproteobacteria bacterium]